MVCPHFSIFPQVGEKIVQPQWLNRLEQDQIVPMDKFRLVEIAEEGFDLAAGTAGDAAGFRA